MILVVFGTTGELIKLAPVLLLLDERGHRYVLATTAQQVQQIPAFLEQFGLRQPDLWLAHGAGGRDLRVNRDIPGWLGRVVLSSARQQRALRHTLQAGPGRPLVLVHGDTMTTVLGTLLGRTLRTTVAHIEGGLRSFDFRHPFPEEVNRKLATVFSPHPLRAGPVGRLEPTPRRHRRHRLEHDPGQPRARAVRTPRRSRCPSGRSGSSRCTASSSSTAAGC